MALATRQFPRDRLFRGDHNDVGGDLPAVIPERGLAMLRAEKNEEISMNRMARAHVACALVWLAVFATAAGAQDGKTPDYSAIIAAPDRADSDRQADARRTPVQLLAFTE